MEGPLRPVSSNYDKPEWILVDNLAYKKYINQLANRYVKMERKKGIIYRVKEVLDKTHKAFVCINGIDPLDGIPMDSSLISIYKISENNELVGREKILRRLPTVVPVKIHNKQEFIVVSLQTQKAKGDMNATEYIHHCISVADYHKMNLLQQ